LETKAKYSIPGWQWILAAMVFFVAVLTCQQYILFDIEQARVLVYESDKIAAQLKSVGGVADFIALFFQQFFLFKVAAAAIMAGIFVVVSICLHKVYIYAAGRGTSLAEKIVCCLPAALLFVYTEDDIFFITGHVAILISSLCLLIGASLVAWKSKVSYILLPLLVLFTGFASSTAVWPMIIALILFSLLYKKDYIAVGVIAISAVLMVGLARYFCLAVDSTELFSPDIYSFRLKSATIMIWVWVAIVVLMLVPFVINKFVSEKIYRNIFVACLAAAAIFGITFNAYKNHHDESTVQRYTLQHWLDTQNYDDACEFCVGRLSNTYTANVFYQIQSMTGGELENAVGGVLQYPGQLVMDETTVRFVRRHLMSLYYYIGYVNGAQRQAFEYNEPTDGMMVPAAIKILAQTNIVQGNYAVAEKYLNYLDHTLFYSDWAQQYRKFLYDDKAVEADAELGPRRKALNIESVPQTWTTLPHIIRQIASSAPELPATNYKKAFLRLGCYNITK